MDRRRFMSGLCGAMGVGALFLIGCSDAADSNLPEAKPATEIDINKAMKDMEEQTKAMGKAPK